MVETELNSQVKDKVDEFSCGYCNKKFSEQTNLKYHLSTVHKSTNSKIFQNESGLYQCKICPSTSRFKPALVLHVRRVHEKRKYHKCDSCDKTFFSKVEVKQHEIIHSEDKQVECELCKKLLHQHYIKQHVNAVHLRRKDHKCDMCDQAFSHSASLKRHKVALHNGVKLEEKKRRKPATCQCCNKTILGKYQLQKHIDTVHSNGKKFECEKCQKAFKQLPNLTRHINTFHFNIKNFHCPVCEAAFGCNSALKQHAKRCHGDITTKREFNCDRCSKNYLSQHDLNNHIANIHESKPEKCDICDKEFRSMRHLRIHKDQVHIEKSKVRDELVCKHCSKEYSSKFNLNDHIQRVHEKSKKHECENCYKRFFSKNGKTLHIKRMHTTGIPKRKVIKVGTAKQIEVKCEICCQAYSSVKSLNTHVENTHDLKPEKCDICEKIFHSSLRLTLHYKTHLKDYTVPETEKEIASKMKKRMKRKNRDFKCLICDKTFPVWRERYKHQNENHEDQKKFECTACSKKYLTEESAKIHFRNAHHRNEMRRHQCPNCVKIFNTPSALQHHIEFVHLQMKSSKCDMCKKSFYNEKYLEKHIKAIHQEIKPLKCENCEMEFSFPSSLKSHIRYKHGSYKCSQCPERFDASTRLNLHVKLVHKIDDLTCEKCKKVFCTKSTMKRHFIRIHEPEKKPTYQCEFCPKKYGTKGNLKKHQMKSHQKENVSKD